MGERKGYSRPAPRRDDSRPRRLLPSRFSRPPVVVETRTLPEPAQGVHADDSPASDLIWGRHAAQAALENGRPVHRIWCTAEMRFSPAFLQSLREAKASGVLVEEVTWARLGQITSGAVHQGIVLQAAAADTLDLASLIDGCRELGEPPLLMALDGITDPHNLGAIARSAEALGAHGLVLPQRRSAGLTGSVAKVAAGALEHLPVARVVNLNRALDSLKQEGYRVVGLAAEGSVSLEQADLDGPLVIVTGSEGDGLSMLTRKHCDQLISIPLRGATPSLNASVATALLLYEVARRGWMKGLRGGDPAPRIVRPQLPNAAAAADPATPSATASATAPSEPDAGLAEPPPFNPELAEPEDAGSPHEPGMSAPEPSLPETFLPEPAPAALELGFQLPQPPGFSTDVQL
jgi:23S rRNA (guanosine2251-2'-O)-methyltransferase